MSNLEQKDDRLCIIGESDPFLANLLQLFAEKSGLWIRRASTGEEVLEWVLRTRPALVIIDPELPGKMRGWEAVQALIANNQNNNISIIIFSWLNKNETTGLIGQVCIYLQKPYLCYEDFTKALKMAGVKIFIK